jgi:orotate phosphoribosyltransferase
MNYRSIRDLTHDLLRWELPSDVEVIVGIPRSGLLAATILALHRNVRLTTVEGLLRGELIHGGPRSPEDPGDFLRRPRRVLVLDDSLLTGRQMAEVRKRLMPLEHHHSTLYAAVYVHPGNQSLLDLFYECIPTPCVFAWNVMHHCLLAHSCVDIDGVLCRDPSLAEGDVGTAYVTSITNVQPRCVPTYRIKYLVTCRPERYRRLTEDWLSRHGIAYDNLIMRASRTARAERNGSGSDAIFKASVYKRTDTQLFIVSSPGLAYDIARLSGGDVLCTDTMELVRPSMIRGVIRGTTRPLRMLRENPGEFVRKVRARLFPGCL